MGYGGARGGGMAPQLQQLTGELGEKLLAGLRDRVADGAFGKVLAEATTGGPRRPGPAGPGGYGSGGYEEEMDEDGGYGSGYGGGYGQSDRQSRAGTPKTEGPVQLTPGVVFLGVADDKELKTQAKEAELDALCIFEVAIKFNVRLGQIINETTIGVYSVLDDKRPGHETAEMNNIQVQVARANGDKDVVEKEMEELFEYIDSTWLMKDLPTNLTEQGVLDRLRPLIMEPPANPMPILAEIRMYKTRGLLNDGNFGIACKGLVGEQVATALISGTDEAKKQAVAPWLPKDG
jgi:hypothetical protein